MLCARCIFDWQNRLVDKHEEVRFAQVIWEGQSLCLIHLNHLRGLPADMNFRHDEPQESTDVDTEGRQTVADRDELASAGVG